MRKRGLFLLPTFSLIVDALKEKRAGEGGGGEEACPCGPREKNAKKFRPPDGRGAPYEKSPLPPSEILNRSLSTSKEKFFRRETFLTFFLSKGFFALFGLKIRYCEFGFFFLPEIIISSR
jgi:hypothetical protein